MATKQKIGEHECPDGIIRDCYTTPDQCDYGPQAHGTRAELEARAEYHAARAHAKTTGLHHMAQRVHEKTRTRNADPTTTATTELDQFNRRNHTAILNDITDQLDPTYDPTTDTYQLTDKHYAGIVHGALRNGGITYADPTEPDPNDENAYYFTKGRWAFTITARCANTERSYTISKRKPRPGALHGLFTPARAQAWAKHYRENGEQTTYQTGYTQADVQDTLIATSHILADVEHEASSKGVNISGATREQYAWIAMADDQHLKTTAGRFVAQTSPKLTLENETDRAIKQERINNLIDAVKTKWETDGCPHWTQHDLNNAIIEVGTGTRPTAGRPAPITPGPEQFSPTKFAAPTNIIRHKDLTIDTYIIHP